VTTVVTVDAEMAVTDPRIVCVTTIVSDCVVPTRETVVPPTVTVEPSRLVAIVKVSVMVEPPLVTVVVTTCVVVGA
jgi:hypothetical protein